MSLRAAINKMCRQCLYDPEPGNGTWRQQVEACTADGRGGYEKCPLFDVRPKTTTKKEASE